MWGPWDRCVEGGEEGGETGTVNNRCGNTGVILIKKC